MEYKLELIFFLLSLATASSFAQSKEDFTEAVEYLRKYGYLRIPLDGGVRHHPPEEIAKALRSFQNATNLNITGELDSATLWMMNKPRCGEEDSFNDVSLKYRIMGYWRKKSLTYRIYNYAPDMGKAKTRLAIQTAFKYWSDVSPLKFKELFDGRADIRISFHSKDKSCPVPFDGRGHVLAHADAPESGLIHFDQDEMWTEGMPYGSNLRIVAAHEIGHALGLGHSQYYKALMAPVYTGFRPDFKLHFDDIKGIQKLYGKPDKSPPKEIPTQVPDPCKARLDAVMLGPHLRAYMFSGKYVWTLSRQGYSPPVLISSIWKELPGSLSAAVHSQRTGKTYFVKGEKLWRYANFKLDGGFPRPLTNAAAGIDSAFYLNKNQKLIFIKGTVYWQWDEISTTDFKSHPKPVMKLFKGFPNNTDGALTWTNGFVYVFKGSEYWKFNPNHKAVERGYPQKTASRWMQCNS